MLRALMGGLLVAVGTAASLVALAVHGAIFGLVAVCAALSVDLVAFADALKKNLTTVTNS
jgi:hypothetical protein